MSVPILYAGSRYKPVPFVPIPTLASTAPHFVSAEIGNVDNSTVVVTFDRDVQADENDYLFGVAIIFNGIPTGMIAGFRQANHAVVRYSLVAGASSTDVLTWAYSGAGFIVSEADGTPLGNVTAQPVTNNVAPADPIGDTLRADAVAYWKMEEASGTRADATGHGYGLIPANGPTNISGKIGNALHLEQTNAPGSDSDYLSCTSSAALQGGKTLSWALWARLTTKNLGFGAQVILGKTNGVLQSLEEYEMGYDPDFGDIFYAYCVGSEGYAYTTSITFGTPGAGVWYFIVVKFDAVTQTLSISVNGGAFDSSQITSGTIGTTSGDLTVGMYLSGGVAAPFYGDIDEVLRLNREISTDEIAYLYNSGAGRALFP